MASTTYTHAVLMKWRSPEDAEKHQGYSHPLYDDFFIDLQHEDLIPLSLDDYATTEVLGNGVFKEFFTSTDLRDRFLAVTQAVADDLGTSFTYEFVDIEPFEFP